MKIFRWQGLVVFAVLFLLIWGFLSFYLDELIERALEEEGSKIIQTQIEVDSVSTSIPSQGGALQRLAVANADNLMENAVEIDSVTFNFDAGKALVRKVVIDEMTVEGIRLNQKRQTPATAYRSPGQEADEIKKDKSGGGGLFGLGKIMNPKSPEEILKSEKLETLEAVEQSKKEIQELKEKWQRKLDTELNLQALEETRKKIEALQKQTQSPGDIAGVAGAVQDLKNIQETIQGNLDRIKILKKEIQEDAAHVKKQVAELKNLPQKDFDRLRKKYSLDVKGGSNLLGSLLGDEIKEKIDLFWKYYEMLSPFLNKGAEALLKEGEEKYVRGKGVFVNFSRAISFPDFLIRHASLSMDLMDTHIAGELKDFSDNQRVYGKPAMIHFRSDKDDKFDHFGLNIKLDRTQTVADDGIDLNVKGLKLNNVEAGEGAKIEKGSADIQSAFKIVNEKEMAGTIQANLNGLSLKIPEQKENEIFNAISNTLASTDRFFIKIAIDGSRENYDVKIESDLDRIISKAVKGAVAGKMQDFEKSLKSSIFSATGGPLAGASDSLGGLLKLEDLVGNNSSAWKGLLDKAQAGALPEPLKNKLPMKEKLPLPGGLEGLKLPF